MFELSILLMISIFMFGAFIKGWSGFGTNLVVPPLLFYMSRFDNMKEIMVIVITVNLFLNIAMLIQSKKFNLNQLKKIWVLVLFGVIFNFVGVYLFKQVDDTWFRILLGIMIILVTLNKMLKLNIQIVNPDKYFIPTGIISGILNGMFGLGGIPVLILLGSSKMDKKEFKSTLVSYFLVMNIIYIISQGILANSYSSFVITNILYVFIFAVTACMFGVYMSSRVSDKIFQRVMNFILLFFGVNLIYNGLFGTHIFFIYKLFV